MIRTSLALTVLATAAASAVAQRPAPKTGFTLEQVTSLPFPDALTAAATGRKLAWELNERGVRNVWVAEGPDFTARQLTPYAADDGQELTSISISADGKWVVYVRGGDHGANWEGPPPNPASLPVAPKVQIWSVPFAGGTPKLLADGDDPVISPKSDVVAFGSGGQRGAGQEDDRRQGSHRGRPVVARRIAAGVRLHPRRPRLHRRLRRRGDADHLDRPHPLARRLAPLVPRRQAAGLRPRWWGRSR